MSNKQQLEKFLEKEYVLPENQAVRANNHKTSIQQTTYVSTERAEESPIFKTQEMEQVFQAQAATAEHLNFMAPVFQQGMNPISALRNEMRALTSQYENIKLPDTRVSIGNRKIEIPYTIKAFADNLDQDAYTRLMAGLLGKKRMRSVRKFAQKSNQHHTPALWLNQAIFIETTKPYVFMLGRDDKSERIIEEEGLRNAKADLAEKAKSYLISALGHELYEHIEIIAKATQLMPWAVLILITEAIVQDREDRNKPVTIANMWEVTEGDDDDE